MSGIRTRLQPMAVSKKQDVSIYQDSLTVAQPSWFVWIKTFMGVASNGGSCYVEYNNPKGQGQIIKCGGPYANGRSQRLFGIYLPRPSKRATIEFDFAQTPDNAVPIDITRKSGYLGVGFSNTIEDGNIRGIGINCGDQGYYVRVMDYTVEKIRDTGKVIYNKFQHYKIEIYDGLVSCYIDGAFATSYQLDSPRRKYKYINFWTDYIITASQKNNNGGGTVWLRNLNVIVK